MNSSETVAITIRPMAPPDAVGIARTYIESAEHHARIDPERYGVPTVEMISARYREGQQHPADAGETAITLIAEIGGDIAGFVDAHLEQLAEAMHKDVIYCHISEIAVSARHRRTGIGSQLLEAAEQWGLRRGAAFASLEYHVANTSAAAFYVKRMGYHAASITAIKRL